MIRYKYLLGFGFAFHSTCLLTYFLSFMVESRAHAKNVFVGESGENPKEKQEGKSYHQRSNQE